MINKAKIIIMGLCCICMGAFAQTATVKGNISGLKETTLVINYYSGKVSKSDTVKVSDGKFTWVAKMPAPQKVAIMFPKRYIQFFAESGTISLEGHVDSLNNLKITGSQTQDEMETFNRSIKDLSDQEMAIYQKWGKGNEEEQNEREEKLTLLRKQKKERGSQYIAEHPKSVFSLSLVSDRAAMGSYAEVKSAFAKLDKSVQETDEGKRIAERLVLLKRSHLGERMLNFTQNDADGKPVKFADFNGKYVLVDFWASWCGPCRAENPNVLKVYNQYKDKNFTVIGISLDNSSDKWKKAIKDDNMPWTQVSDLKGFENEVSTYYGIRGIPSTLLIDPQGKIIAKDLRGVELRKKLAELFQ